MGSQGSGSVLLALSGILHKLPQNFIGSQRDRNTALEFCVTTDRQQAHCHTVVYDHRLITSMLAMTYMTADRKQAFWHIVTMFCLITDR